MKEYDLTLLFPNDKQGIHTNGDFLSKESVVFHKLIFEDPQKPKTTLVINDDPTVTYQALRCLHTLGSSLTSVEIAASVRSFGLKYQIGRLIALCEKYVMMCLKPENAAEIHDVACRHMWKNIQYCCWLMFDMAWKEMFSNTSFYNCSPLTIMRFVSRPIYSDLSEFFLWNAIYTWGLTKVLRENSVQNPVLHREVLKTYLPHIRFLTMKKEELNSVFKSNILTTEECCAIKEAYESNDVSKLPSTICHSTIHRTTTGIEQCVSHIKSHYCIKHTIVRWVKADDTFFSEFKVNYDCFLTGIILPLHMHVVETRLYAHLEMSKTLPSNNKKDHGSRDLQLLTHFINLFPPIFLERNCKVNLSIRMIKDGIGCQIEPYASCHIGDHSKELCEEAEEWKQFYVKDVVLYF